MHAEYSFKRQNMSESKKSGKAVLNGMCQGPETEDYHGNPGS